jgi:hypothetical protein
MRRSRSLASSYCSASGRDSSDWDDASVYFLDAMLTSAFVARWCAGSKVETDGGVFRIRDDEPAPRIGAAPHRTP